MKKSEEEWRSQLSDEQFQVTRKKGTERGYSSNLNEEHGPGIFICVCCKTPLFSSNAKFDSGTGWPSFFAPQKAGLVTEYLDRSFFSHRTEIRCAKCDAHLGHVFPDGPEPTGLRYCMNGVALEFVPRG